MSYDIYLEINTGKEMHTVVDVGNYTSNVGNMWGHALQEADEELGLGIAWLSDLHGWKAEDALLILHRAIMEMENNPGFYRAMNPENGWGNYEGAKAYLETLATKCEEHPACTIFISH